MNDDVNPHEGQKLVTKKDLPVLVGQNYEHVMGKATIEQVAEVRNKANEILSSPRVTITIVSEGPDALLLGDYVAMNEVIALSFGAVPVRPVPKKEN